MNTRRDKAEPKAKATPKVERKKPTNAPTSYTRDDTNFLYKMGRRVAAARVQLHISQEELAKRAKVSKGYIGLIEVGKRNPHVLTLKIIAKVLGVPVHQFLNFEH